MISEAKELFQSWIETENTLEHLLAERDGIYNKWKHHEPNREEYREFYEENFSEIDTAIKVVGKIADEMKDELIATGNCYYIKFKLQSLLDDLTVHEVNGVEEVELEYEQMKFLEELELKEKPREAEPFQSNLFVMFPELQDEIDSIEF